MIAVRSLVDDNELEVALKLRERVFCIEQGVALHEELDGLDVEAEHLVAVIDGTIVGTCRLLKDGDGLRLGRMVVARPHRRRGVAQAMLAVAHMLARSRGLHRMTLHAQLTARPVYERAGYTEHGPVFLDAGMEHVAMALELA